MSSRSGRQLAVFVVVASFTSSASRADALSAGEAVRVRGGFSVNGGGGFGVASGATVSGAVRMGAQFNRWFSTYYQASPMVFVAGHDSGLVAGFLVANAVLANVTLGDVLEIGVGPSVDYVALGGCGVGVDCAAAKAVEFGVHGRVALQLGSRNPSTGRRSVFSIGLDIHPVFTPAGTLFLGTLGIGGEWLESNSVDRP